MAKRFLTHCLRSALLIESPPFPERVSENSSGSPCEKDSVGGQEWAAVMWLS
jgi:hypothetical protein